MHHVYCRYLFTIVPLLIHTTYSTASFLLGIDVTINGRQVFVKNIDRGDACFENLDIDGLHTILMGVVKEHGIHSVQAALVQ